MKQKTLNQQISLEGVGIHSGARSKITLIPAEENTGIVFLLGDVKIPASYKNSVSRPLCSCLSVKQNGQEVSIFTMEHLMGALSIYQIDNLFIELSSPELPIMDGSANDFAFAIEAAGIKIQEKDKEFIKIKKEIKVGIDNCWAKLSPSDTGLQVSFEIAFDHPVLKNDSKLEVDFSATSLPREILRARTFGFLKDYDYLKQNGFAKGASLENTVVVGEDKVLNPEGLRFKGEFLKHKILDSVGDLYLAGKNIIGYFSAYKSGHALHKALLDKLFATSDAYEVVLD